MSYGIKNESPAPVRTPDTESARRCVQKARAYLPDADGFAVPAVALANLEEAIELLVRARLALKGWHT